MAKTGRTQSGVSSTNASRALRTYTPTQLAIAKSAGSSTGRPKAASSTTSRRACSSRISATTRSMAEEIRGLHGLARDAVRRGFFEAVPLTAYNAITAIEAGRSPPAGRAPASEARRHTPRADPVGRLRLRGDPEGALGCARHRSAPATSSLPPATAFTARRDWPGRSPAASTTRTATRACDSSPFPRRSAATCRCATAVRPGPYRAELDAIHSTASWDRLPHHRAIPRRRRLVPSAEAEYLQLLQAFCREHDIVFILDEVQANFGRTGRCSPSRPTASSPTSSCWARGWATACPRHARPAGPTCSRALELRRGVRHVERQPAVLRRRAGHARRSSKAMTSSAARAVRRRSSRKGFLRLKELPFVAHVRGEKGGMVWGVEIDAWGGRTASEIARACVLAAYRGDSDGRAVHLMGPLAEGSAHRSAAHHDRGRGAREHRRACAVLRGSAVPAFRSVRDGFSLEIVSSYRTGKWR